VQWSDRTFVLGGWVPQSLPFLLAPPMSQVVSVGQDVVLGVGVSGAPAPAYQWRKEGVPIPGATGATLALPAVQADAAGNYSVVVTNALGSVTSLPASLAVTPLAGAPVIVTPPTPQTASIGDAATLSVAASGASGLIYQWSRNGAALVGATGPTLTLNALQLADAGQYGVTVAGAVGSVTSAPVALSVRATPLPAAPTIATPPASQIAFAGSTVNLSVVARGLRRPTSGGRTTPRSPGPRARRSP
jgi:hypothetical protein